jgi:integrase
VIADFAAPVPKRPDVAWIKKHVSVSAVAQELGLEVVSRTMARCWRGQNHRNADADPSLRFHLAKNRARCFVCDLVGGLSVIDLVMGVLERDFPSAVEWICERFPVPSAKRGSPIGPRSNWPQSYRTGVSGSEFESLIRSGVWAQLSPTQRSILPVLLAFRDSDTGVTTISYRGLMRYSGVGSPKSISRAIWRLQALHVLKVYRAERVGVVQSCSSYYLTLEDPQFIQLLNEVHSRHRASIDRERTFRSRLRSLRERETLGVRNSLSCMKVMVSAPTPILHVDFLCIENQLQLPHQGPNLSCTGELLSSPIEVQTNKPMHHSEAREGSEQSACASKSSQDESPKSPQNIDCRLACDLETTTTDCAEPESSAQIDLQPEPQTTMLRGQGQAANERGGSLARRRYQRGMLLQKGTKDGQGRIDKERSVWIGRWREDEIREGRVYRVRRHEFLGTFADFPTRKLALRELEKRISFVNDPGYRARPVATFGQFAERWESTVLVQHKPSTQATMRSHMKKYLVPVFGDLPLRDIQPENVQRFIAGMRTSPKTVRNLFITLQLMWNSARAWQYVSHNALDGVVLPKPRRARTFFFTREEVQRILAAAPEPYRTFYWLAAETGMRAGELCGLRLDDIELSRGIVNVRQSVWHGKLQDPKSENAVRAFAISSQLREHLRALVEGWRPNQERLAFATRNGSPWDASLVVKRKLRPLLRELKIQECGLHAFRHANASLMDELQVPMKVRQHRLGHSDPRLTMNTYTHMASADDERIAEQLGEILDAVGRKHEHEPSKEKGPAARQALLN